MLNTIYRVVRISNKRASDAHARVVVSNLHDVTKIQTKETRAHFSHVSFGEFVKVSIVHDIDAFFTI